jgi:hypothetical protein
MRQNINQMEQLEKAELKSIELLEAGRFTP